MHTFLFLISKGNLVGSLDEFMKNRINYASYSSLNNW
jgi:hypothetical protein